MTRLRFRPLPFVTLVLLAAVPSAAQEMVQALPGSTDADKLADDMRTLAANPRDVDALVDAARLSLKLDDISGAASLLQRAENVDPRNPRVKAGQGSVLVQSERPGQALRYFAQAEAEGLDPRTFAVDRGLAYDLTGEQARAQRDYARALRDVPDDAETIRRYALSLGISGERQRALALLDPLVRKSDRGAWRTQAFVLAMTGDVGGASRIAATMIPGGAAGLSAFFERLPALSPTDRAFAVHFGEVRPSPERFADARLAPPLGALPREPGVAIAVAQPSLAAPSRVRRDRPQPPAPLSPVVTAAATPPRSVPPAVSTSVRAPSASSQAPVVVATLPPANPARSVPSPVAPAQATIAVRTPPASVSPAQAAVTPPIHSAFAASAPPQVAAAAPRAVPSVPPPSTAPVLAAAREPAGTIVAATVPRSLPASVATSPASMPVATPAATQPAQIAAASPPEVARASAAELPVPAPAPVQTVELPPSTRSATPQTLTNARSSEDSILAKIIANLSIPDSELGVQGPERPAAVALPRPEPVAVASAESDRAAVDKLAAEKLAAEKLAAERAAADKAAAAKAAADRKAAAAKAAADKKALAEKKEAAEKKALADKEAAEKRKAERADPQRIWVQVAGGAYEGDLLKAFATVKAKAPAVFGSRGGWTTPLRATNRVLAGPFKTDAEARAFVNDLKKQGVSAFTFTSDAGQPVKKLTAK